MSQQQSLDFLATQNFSLTATGTGTTTGTYSLGWGTGNTDSWTAPALTSAPNDFNQNRPFWLTAAFIQVNLPTGTYSLSTAGTSINRAVFDGVTVYKKGTNWFSIPACTLTVT